MAKNRQKIILLITLFLSCQNSWSLSFSKMNKTLREIYQGKIPKNTQELKMMSAWQEKLVEEVQPKVVGIVQGNQNGTGVIVSADGYVLTAAHVSGKANSKVFITLRDGKVLEGISMGGIFHSSENMVAAVDAGLVKITTRPPTGGWPFAKRGSSAFHKEKDWVMAMGHAGGVDLTRYPRVRLCRISDSVLTSEDPILLTDCPIAGGDSGGPVFNMIGEVIGINSRIGVNEDTNLHVPITTFNLSWEQLLKGEETTEIEQKYRPELGVKGVRNEGNARVDVVNPDGPAEKAGIAPGDIIKSIDGVAVGSFEELVFKIEFMSAGERINLVVERDGTKYDKKILVGRKEY